MLSLYKPYTHSTLSLCSRAVTTLLPISPLSCFQNHLYIYLPLFFLISNWFYLHHVSISVSSLSFLLHALLLFSTCASFFPSAFVKQTKSSDSQEKSTSRTFVLKHFINLAADGLGALAFPICWCLRNKICVKYIWFDWGVFTCFPNSHHGLWVQANIVSMCVCLSVSMCCTVCVCCQTMHDWPEILSYNLLWNVEPRDGEERQRGSEEDEEQRWKDRGNNNSGQ